MALINQKGEYLKINSFDLRNNTVLVEIYENKEHREQGNSDYKRNKEQVYSLPRLAELVQTIEGVSGTTIKNSIFIIAYNELKSVNGFTDWEDDLDIEQKDIVSIIESQIPSTVQQVDEEVEQIKEIVQTNQ